MARSLYICYFGVREPLVQTQVIPYLRELVKGGHEISLLTFEPGEIVAELQSAGVAELKSNLAEQGIDWHWLKYHKRFSVLATTFDIFQGTLFVRKMIARRQLDILHGRVHVPTLMGALARMFSRRKPKLLFDIRGFFPEEYTDAGVWPEGGWLYRTAKRVERWLLKESDGFVVLTEKARGILFPESVNTGFDKLNRPVEVIPCCVDLRRFQITDSDTRQRVREEIGAEGRSVTVYAGSLGGWYLTKETADFYGELKKADENSFALILTQSNPQVIEPLLKERGLTTSDYFITKVAPSEISTYFSAADAALSFCKPSYSKQAASPTKNAEYLASGLPIIANRNVGDVDRLIGENRVGVMVSDFNSSGYIMAVKEIEQFGDIREWCREVAEREFDLEKVGGERYRRLYKRLMEMS